jgi:hypothetical protein
VGGAFRAGGAVLGAPAHRNGRVGEGLDCEAWYYWGQEGRNPVFLFHPSPF